MNVDSKPTSPKALRFHDPRAQHASVNRLGPARDFKFPMASTAKELPPSSGSNSSGESDAEPAPKPNSDDEGRFEFSPPVVSTPMEDPMMNSGSSYGWSTESRRSNRTSIGSANGLDRPAGHNPQTPGPRPTRPANTRQPSNAYAPPRRPQQIRTNTRNLSTTRTRRVPNANAEYRAQEKAYVQRLRQDALEDEYYVDDLHTPSLTGLDSDSAGTDDESPSTADYIEDPYDQETLLYYGTDDLNPSEEEKKIPANRERLEWHSMLANVLTGDVVKQEKKRLIGNAEKEEDPERKAEIWMGVRARVCGRSLQHQKRYVEDGREQAKALIEEIVNFTIKGEAEVGKSAAEQVRDIVKKIGKCESLYPTRQSMEEAHPRSADPPFKDACDAVIAWHNTTELINTEVMILQNWVGNEELDFVKPRQRSDQDSRLADESSFIDRILKEDGLKSLSRRDGLLAKLNDVITKAKYTFIANAEAFAVRHLPPFIEELLTLINFPSRLVQEIIKVRLKYARKVKDPASQGIMMTEQMITQFQILLQLATQVKESYTIVIEAQSGWEPPPCLEDGFDTTVLEALRYYFRMLNWKLAANKNTFKEAEILEQEWDFCSKLSRSLEGGDVEVAEQFSVLTSKSLTRLTNHFERSLQRKPTEVTAAELDKRYKQILDNVRVRQRKMFRFSRILTQRFENSTEFNLNIDSDHLGDLVEALELSGHVLLQTNDAEFEKSDSHLLAAPTLEDRPDDIHSLLRTCYHAEENPDDPSNPYVLILRLENAFHWNGKRIPFHSKFKLPAFELKPNRLRLVADGSQQRLASANYAFMQEVGVDLTKVVEQRANLNGVNNELQKIKKTAYKLSNTIMDSVAIVRQQTVGLECQDLIQACFAFATEFGQRSVLYLDHNRKALNNIKLTKLALDWVQFICDDCISSERKTFSWAVKALEFAMIMTRGQNILSLESEDYNQLRQSVAGCMALLISHFDIMGARSTLAAQMERKRMDDISGKMRYDMRDSRDDEESMQHMREQWLQQLAEIDDRRKVTDSERQILGRVLEDSNEADRALTYLSSSATNVTIRWQQGAFVGGGSFGSVYAATNLDSGHLMAVKEIRLQDPQLIPTIVSQIRDEMGVLQVLDHPNIVSYYGIEPHRDKVYIFMEYCGGGSLASLLEHGRIEDETVISVYALQMLEGLAYLHESGVVHRDIKPENILLDYNGVIKFVDFGAAKVIARQGKTLAGNSRAPQKSMTGTPMYMSPEVIKGSAPGRHGAVDIWSLGCVVLEMATGRRPWASLDNEWAIMYNIAQGNPPQLPNADQLSETGIEFLRDCFVRDPAKRASAVELLQHDWIMALRAQLSLEPVGTPMTPSTESSGGLSRQDFAKQEPLREEEGEH